MIANISLLHLFLVPFVASFVGAFLGYTLARKWWEITDARQDSRGHH